MIEKIKTDYKGMVEAIERRCLIQLNKGINLLDEKKQGNTAALVFEVDGVRHQINANTKCACLLQMVYEEKQGLHKIEKIAPKPTCGFKMGVKNKDNYGVYWYANF